MLHSSITSPGASIYGAQNIAAEEYHQRVSQWLQINLLLCSLQNIFLNDSFLKFYNSPARQTEQ